MSVVLLIFIFLFIIACATVVFEQSLREKGGFVKKLLRWITGVIDAFFGLG
jgi:hypothetical protein